MSDHPTTTALLHALAHRRIPPWSVWHDWIQAGAPGGGEPTPVDVNAPDCFIAQYAERIARLGRLAVRLGANQRDVVDGVRFYRICGNWTLEIGAILAKHPHPPAWQCSWDADLGMVNTDREDHALSAAEVTPPSSTYDYRTNTRTHPAAVQRGDTDV